LHYIRQHLLVTNRGPREEGYTYCLRCGSIEATSVPRGVVSAAHRKPFPDTREPNCPGGPPTRGLVLGTDFITDVLLVSLSIEPPLALVPGLLATDSALRTVSEALSRAACALLELEPEELQAEYRPALTARGRQGREAEIYLYDTLPGGAGFSQRASQLGLPLFTEALKILEQCPDNCDRSCYRCLRSYKNKFEHDLLDRHLGALLLRHLLTGAPAVLNKARTTESTHLLYQDLERQRVPSIAVERNGSLSVPGLGTVTVPILVKQASGDLRAIGIHGSLTPDVPVDDVLLQLKEYSVIPVRLVDEIEVRRNLPRATSDLLREFI